MRSQENPEVLQVMAMVVLLLLFNIYGVPKAAPAAYSGTDTARPPAQSYQHAGPESAQRPDN